MRWETEFTNEFEQWYRDLPQSAQDSRRVAVLLLGGDKQHKWQQWYRTAIPEADRLYAKHLKTIRNRG